MKTIFKQIRIDKDISEKDGFGVVFISSILMAVIIVFLTIEFEFPVYLIFILILIYVFFGRLQIRKLFSDWPRRKDIIGTLEVDENCIKIKNKSKNETINLSDLKSIYLHYNHIQGKLYASRDIIHNGLAELKLKTKDNKEQSIKFLIENEKQINDLKPIWKTIYLSGVFVREKMGKYEVKTVMFDGKLTDEKIRGLKTELNVDSFY